MTYRFPLLASGLALLPLTAALAGGFQSLTPSAPALGMAGAVTATARDASAGWFNPGALARLDSADFSLGLSALRVGRVFRSAATDRQATTEGATLLAPYLYAAAPLAKGRVVVGLSLNQPFGYQTKWPADWQGRAVLTESRVRTAAAQATVAFRLTERFSLGAGLVAVGADYELDRAVGEFSGATAHYKASGKGLAGNFGVQGQIGEAVAFGIAYRTAATVKMTNGEATMTGIPASQSGAYPATSKFSTRLRLPGTLSAGIANRVTDKLDVNFTFELTGWSVYDSLNVSFDDHTVAPQRSARAYEDAMAFRVGAEYRPTDKVALRLGAYYDESPVRDQNLTPDLPDANLLGGTAGVGFHLGRLRADIAYTMGISATRNARVNQTNTQMAALAGEYRNNQHGAALGLSYQF